jgi:hypothetical protein
MIAHFSDAAEKEDGRLDKKNLVGKGCISSPPQSKINLLFAFTDEQRSPRYHYLRSMKPVRSKMYQQFSNNNSGDVFSKTICACNIGESLGTWQECQWLRIPSLSRVLLKCYQNYHRELIKIGESRLGTKVFLIMIINPAII